MEELRKWIRAHFSPHFEVNDNMQVINFVVIQASDTDYGELESLWDQLHIGEKTYKTVDSAIRKFTQYYINKLMSHPSYLAEMQMILDRYQHDFMCIETFKAAESDLNFLLDHYRSLLADPVTPDSIFMEVNRIPV